MNQSEEKAVVRDDVKAISRALWIAAGVFVFLTVGGMLALTVIVIETRQGTEADREQAAAISSIAEMLNRPLVSEWVIDVDAPDGTEFVVGEEPIPMLGTFRCSEQALEADPLVQFRGTFVANDTGGVINRQESASVNISRSCNQNGPPVAFPWPWTDSLIRSFDRSLTEPSDYTISLSVRSVDGSWLEASAATEKVVTLVPRAAADE